jgi:cobaltochelatase CobT
MSNNVDVVRQSITIIAKVLSGKGIKVTQSGTNAYVESDNGIPKRINIPYIPDNASEELILAINGFLDHEVAHVLFTDFTVSQKEHFLNHAIFQIYNAIEDCRIEKCMRAKFAGSRTNLDGVSAFFIDKYIEPELIKCDSEKELLTALFTPAIRAWSGQAIFQNYMKDKWAKVSSLEEKIASVIPEIALVNSTQASIDLAHVIGKLLKKDKSPKTDNKEKGKKAEASEEEKGEHVSPPESDELGEERHSGLDDESESQPDDKPTDEEADDKSEQASEDEPDLDESKDDEPDLDEPDSDDSKDDEPNESENEPSKSDQQGESDDVNEGNDESDTSDEDQGEGDSDNNDESGSESDDVGLTLDLESLIESASSDMSRTISDIIAGEVKDCMMGSQYSVYSTEYDVIKRLDISNSDPARIKKVLSGIEARAREVTGPLQKTLERLVKSKSMVRNLPGKRSGRINASSLFRLKTGDDRVFRQRDMGISNDVAVSLVVDCSGSMAGSKIRTAMESAYALCDVLTRLDISNEVIGFTTMSDDGGMYSDFCDSNDTHSFYNYSRREALHIPIFKGFDERFGIQQKQRMAVGSQFNSTDGLRLLNNVDGESIRIAANRLMTMTKEKTKQMIVLSDGSPSAYGDYLAIHKDLISSIAKIEKMGVNIIGIGINDDNVTRYYKNNLVINNISELPNQIIKELRSLLV